MEHGRFRQVGTPLEVYQRPTSRFVASFIGSVPMNLLPATVDDGMLRIDGNRIPIPADDRDHLSAGDKVVVGARPEYAELLAEATDGAIAGTVAVVELLGTEYLVTVEEGDVSVQATTPEAPRPGSAAWVRFDHEHTLLYRADDGELVGSARAEEPADAMAATG